MSDVKKQRIPEPPHVTEIYLKSISDKRNKYNRLATADDLGMHKSTLFRKIKTLGIDLPEIDGRACRKKTDRVA